MSKVAKYVLGLSLSHDGSACLIKDGIPLVAIAKERLTRIKHDGYNDLAAAMYCVSAAGITLDDLDLIVQNTWEGSFARGNQWFKGPRLIPAKCPVITIPHHLAHAYSAYGASPHSEAVVFVADNGGNTAEDAEKSEEVCGQEPVSGLKYLFVEVDSYYTIDESGWRCHCKAFSALGRIRDPYPFTPLPVQHSIGGLYKAASEYVFGDSEDAGKLMGLAPYGTCKPEDEELFTLKDGFAFINYDALASFNKPSRDPLEFKARFAEFANIARRVQNEIERALQYVLAQRTARWPGKDLCYAGGVALNAVANSVLARDRRFESIFVQPAAADDGISLGCAYYGWLVALAEPKRNRPFFVALGRARDRDSVISAVERAGTHDLSVCEPVDAAAAVASQLASGAVVGWYAGGSEFGPRALGQRSILADPRNSDNWLRINRLIKNREEFRPFAPAMLLDEFATHCEPLIPDSPYMLYVLRVSDRSAALMPAVIHRDGTARVQTVSDNDGEFFRLLNHFRSLTGIGVLLNTSLNQRGQPIVETPDQALTLFLESDMDAIYVAPFLVSKGKGAESISGIQFTYSSVSAPASMIHRCALIACSLRRSVLIMNEENGKVINATAEEWQALLPYLRRDCALRIDGDGRAESAEAIPSITQHLYDKLASIGLTYIPKRRLVQLNVMTRDSQ